MKTNLWNILLSKLLLCICIQLPVDAFACSMYKITCKGKTMVGNNEDSWRTSSCIRFEQGREGCYGVAYVGYSDKAAPDGALNECGLVFDAFTMPYKSKMPPRDPRLPDFSYALLDDIMQQCGNTNDVYTFLSRYNLHILNGSLLFNGGMLFFADSSGNYLVVEADTLIRGKDPAYLLANFSVAGTPDPRQVRMERYRRGVSFIEQNGIDSSLAFCTALSHTMSVCRSRIGDGTLYTSIYDLKEGLVHLLFYHDYTRRVSFRLRDELARGDHTQAIPALFPPNAEYLRFLRFLTPHNNPVLKGILLLFGLLFFFSAVFFLLTFLHGAFRQGKIRYAKLFMMFLALASAYYIYVLLRNQAVFYMPSPYRDPGASLLNIAAYVPFLQLGLAIPLLRLCIYLFRKKTWSIFGRYLFLLNNISLLVLLGLYVYWGFFRVSV